MRFTKLIAKNVERLAEDDAKRFTFTTDVLGEDPPSSVFEADHIELLQNGWVLVVLRYDEVDMCIPPWRVISIENIIE